MFASILHVLYGGRVRPGVSDVLSSTIVVMHEWKVEQKHACAQFDTSEYFCAYANFHHENCVLFDTWSPRTFTTCVSAFKYPVVPTSDHCDICTAHTPCVQLACLMETRNATPIKLWSADNAVSCVYKAYSAVTFTCCFDLLSTFAPLDMLTSIPSGVHFKHISSFFYIQSTSLISP